MTAMMANGMRLKIASLGMHWGTLGNRSRVWRRCPRRLWLLHPEIASGRGERQTADKPHDPGNRLDSHKNLLAFHRQHSAFPFDHKRTDGWRRTRNLAFGCKRGDRYARMAKGAS